MDWRTGLTGGSGDGDAIRPETGTSAGGTLGERDLGEARGLGLWEEDSERSRHRENRLGLRLGDTLVWEGAFVGGPFLGGDREEESEDSESQLLDWRLLPRETERDRDFLGGDRAFRAAT